MLILIFLELRLANSVTCTVGNYDNAGVCTPCTSNCGTCNANGCTACSASYFLKSDKTCGTSCPANSYIRDRVCITCTINCNSCTENGCTACANSYVLLIDKTCGSACTLGTYNNNNVCTACSSNCDACNSAGCSSCQLSYVMRIDKTCSSSCPVGFYNKNQVCTACPNNCDTCNMNTCLICSESTILNSDKTCVAACPKGSYNNSKVCTSCSMNCNTCNSNGCISCAANYVLKLSKTCGSLCPIGSYNGNGICNACTDNCDTCDSTGCIKCANSFYKLQNLSCSKQCPSGHYISKQVCTVCNKCQQQLVRFYISSIIQTPTGLNISIIPANPIPAQKLKQINKQTFAIRYIYQNKTFIQISAQKFTVLSSGIILLNLPTLFSRRSLITNIFVQYQLVVKNTTLFPSLPLSQSKLVKFNLISQNQFNEFQSNKQFHFNIGIGVSALFFIISFIIYLFGHYTIKLINLFQISVMFALSELQLRYQLAYLFLGAQKVVFLDIGKIFSLPATFSFKMFSLVGGTNVLSSLGTTFLIYLLVVILLIIMISLQKFNYLLMPLKSTVKRYFNNVRQINAYFVNIKFTQTLELRSILLSKTASFFVITTRPALIFMSIACIANGIRPTQYVIGIIILLLTLAASVFGAISQPQVRSQNKSIYNKLKPGLDYLLDIIISLIFVTSRAYALVLLPLIIKDCTDQIYITRYSRGAIIYLLFCIIDYIYLLVVFYTNNITSVLVMIILLLINRAVLTYFQQFYHLFILERIVQQDPDDKSNMTGKFSELPPARVQIQNQDGEGYAMKSRQNNLQIDL